MTEISSSRLASSHVRRLCALAVFVSLALGAGPTAHAATAPSPVTFAISDDAAQRAFPSELTSARGIGISAARAYVGWANVATRRPAQPRNPADSAYNWSLPDADMARYAAAGMQVWIALWATPAWASGSTDTAVWPAEGERPRRLRLRGRAAVPAGEGLHGLERAQPQGVCEAE